MGSKLEKVESSIEEENGKHIAVITVKERTSSRSSGSFTANPMIRFNRVSGWKLGFTTVKIEFSKRHVFSKWYADLKYFWVYRLRVW